MKTASASLGISADYAEFPRRGKIRPNGECKNVMLSLRAKTTTFKVPLKKLGKKCKFVNNLMLLYAVDFSGFYVESISPGRKGRHKKFMAKISISYFAFWQIDPHVLKNPTMN